MHSHITISRADFPNLMPDNLATGDRIQIIATGIVRRIEEDLVDTTGYGTQGPRHVLGDTEYELLIIEARRPAH